MAFDDPPYFIDGDVSHVINHSAGVMRLAAYVGGNGGREGVINALDCQCKALSTPGGSIRIIPGAVAIKARHLGGSNQLYLSQVLSDHITPVTPTGAGSTRYDLVMVRIWNPFVAGEPTHPTGTLDGPFIDTYIKENVASTTKTVTELGLGYTAIPIARLAIPPSTATITQGMITDLRFGAAPKGDDDHDPGSTPGPVSPETLTPSDGTYKDFPIALTQSVKIPIGASQARITAKINGIATTTGSFTGKLRVVVNGVNLDEYPLSGIAANTPVNINVTKTYTGAALIALWGQTITIKTQGKWTSGGGTLSFSDSGSSGLKVTFDRLPWLD